MFGGEMREAFEKEVTLGEVTGDVLLSLVEYCYTGNIELNVDTVEALWITASFLQFSGIFSACSAFLSRHIKPTNCLRIAPLAEQHNCELLLKKAQEVALKHFRQVSRNEYFVQLTADDLGKMLASDNLHVRSERDVFNALVTWFKHDLETRQRDIPNLLEHIRWPLLHPTVSVRNNRRLKKCS